MASRGCGYVYVADDESGCCKVGHSGDPEGRVAGMRTGNTRIRLVYYRALPKVYEKLMHVELTRRGLHYDREWFRCKSDTIIALLDEIDALHPLATLVLPPYPRMIPPDRPRLDWMRHKHMRY